MLYNDDYEEVNNSSFLPVYKDIAKKKKISVAVFLLIAISIIVIFNVIYTIVLDKNSKETAQLAQSLYENKVEEEIVAKEEPEEIVAVETKANMDERPLLASHDINLIRSKFLPKQLENPQETIKNLYFSEEKQVFLTFDDGPSKTVTIPILDLLKQENIKANFFVLGSRVELYPKIVKRAYEEGHYIANHGYSHKYSQIYTSPASVLEEYNKTNQAVKDAIGKQLYNTNIFRFPGGSIGGIYNDLKQEAKGLLEQNNIATVDWNALNGDSEGLRTEEALLNRVKETIQGKNSVVILMHDAADKTKTYNTLPQIIDYLKQEGYEFKTFYDILGN